MAQQVFGSDHGLTTVKNNQNIYSSSHRDWNPHQNRKMVWLESVGHHPSFFDRHHHIFSPADNEQEGPGNSRSLRITHYGGLWRHGLRRGCCSHRRSPSYAARWARRAAWEGSKAFPCLRLSEPCQYSKRQSLQRFAGSYKTFSDLYLNHNVEILCNKSCISIFS